MSLSVPNTGATAVEANRYAVITQERLLTSLNCRPIVGSAVATMVWSRAARNIVSNRLIRMVRTSSGVSGARGASDGASETSMTSVVMCESSRAKSSGNVVWSAESCRSNLFISDAIFFYTALAAGMESLFPALFTGEITCQAAPWAHGCIPSPPHRKDVKWPPPRQRGRSDPRRSQSNPAVVPCDTSARVHTLSGRLDSGTLARTFDGKGHAMAEVTMNRTTAGDQDQHGI